MRIVFFFLLTLLCVCARSSADDVSSAVREAVTPFIEEGEIAGAVTLVARKGDIVSVEAMGLSDLATGRAMQKDDLFWIASMTKPTVGVAIMMLAEEGKLDIHDEVEVHLPEFKDQWMVAEKSKTEMILKRPARKITLLDLATHTAGIPNVNEPRNHSTLAELVSLISQRPLESEPGSRWKYSSSGTHVLARVVEVVSGQRFQDFVQKRLFDPLGMKDTTFFPSKQQADRLAKPYLKDDKVAELTETEIRFLKGDLWDTKRTVKPGGGLFSTAEDLRRFYQMMLNGGVWEGKQILSEGSVRELTRTQSGNIETGFTEGMSWGIKFQVVREPQGVTAMLNPGTFGHGGAYGTQSWADPVSQTIYILMIQRRGFPNGDNSPVRMAFQKAAAGALQADEASTKGKSAEQDARQSREFRAAMAAHHICSGLWVVGRSYKRTPEEVVAQDVAPFEVFGWEPDFEYKVDHEQRTVTVTAPGAPPRTARYNGDQGSTILPLGEENVFYKPIPVPRDLPDAATQAWPLGDVGASAPIPDAEDAKAVAAALDWAMEQEEQHTRAFVVAQGGKIIGERYAPGWTAETPQLSWSQGKSITATLIGVLVERGLLKIDQPAPIKEWQAEGDPRREILIRDLLHMSGGLDFTNLGIKGAPGFTTRNEHMRVYFDSINVFEHVISQPLKVPPNTRYSYLNTDPLTLGAIVRRTVEAEGEDYLTFPQRALFDRIGARSPVLETDAWGNFILSGYEYISARDWIRFGLLYLWDGVWQGERILPEGWTEFVSSPAPADKNEKYGGLFWLNRSSTMDRVPKDAYWSAGFMGQVTLVIPSRDMVVVRLGPSPGGFYPYLNKVVGRILETLPETDHE